MRDRVGSLTWHLLKRGTAMRGTLAADRGGSRQPIAKFGPDCVDWLGVPLLRGGKVVGGIVVQSYTEAARYTDRDQALLTYVAQHIQTALERRSVHEELERRVAERTDALREANRLLQQQVLERQRGERLQAALFRIAELANTHRKPRRILRGRASRRRRPALRAQLLHRAARPKIANISRFRIRSTNATRSARRASSARA